MPVNNIHMKKIVFAIFFLVSLATAAQNRISDEDRIIKLIHEVLSENKFPNDSLGIYALNFDLYVSKKNGKAFPSSIVANDSLAYEMFPEYRKIGKIDFASMLKGRSSVRVIIPVLVFCSPEIDTKYRDSKGASLINFKAAVNAAMALNDPSVRYSNHNDAEMKLQHRLYKQEENNKILFVDAIFIRPYIYEILNIK